MAVLKRVAPYADDEKNLPVGDVESALPFYQDILGFRLVSRTDEPRPAAVLARDSIEIGLCENGGDPEQEGCFFEVDDAAALWEEWKANGLDQAQPSFRVDRHGETSYKVFFVVAPDGLCYCIGERQG